MKMVTKPCLTGNTRNELATFLHQHWNKATSCFQVLDYGISRKIQEEPCRFIWERNKGHLKNRPSFIEIHQTKGQFEYN